MFDDQIEGRLAPSWNNSGVVKGATALSTHGIPGTGQPVIMDNWSIARSQEWFLRDREGGVILENRMWGTVLDVAGASTEAHAKVIAWPRHGLPNQVWDIVPYSTSWDHMTTFQLINRGSGMALDVPWGSHQAGTELQQYPASVNNPAQAFCFRFHTQEGIRATTVSAEFSQLVGYSFLHVRGTDYVPGANVSFSLHEAGRPTTLLGYAKVAQNGSFDFQKTYINKQKQPAGSEKFALIGVHEQAYCVDLRPLESRYLWNEV